MKKSKIWLRTAPPIPQVMWSFKGGDFNVRGNVKTIIKVAM
ncbi:MAG: hypothetical protein AABY79_13595 [Nitrospirota bacterium]